MTPKKAAAYLIIAVLSAAWFASAVGMPPQPTRSPGSTPSASDEARFDALAREVQAQSARLRERLSTAPVVRAPVRNPFSFVRRETGSPSPSPPAVLAAEPEPEPGPREPLLALVGVAEHRTANGLVRTAMISEDAQQLHMVTEGQQIAGLFVVVAVGAEAVELKTIATGDTRRLVLK